MSKGNPRKKDRLPSGVEYAFFYHLCMNDAFKPYRHFDEIGEWWYLIIDWKPKELAEAYGCELRFMYDLMNKSCDSKIAELRLTKYGRQLFFKKDPSNSKRDAAHNSCNVCTDSAKSQEYDCTISATVLHNQCNENAQLVQTTKHYIEPIEEHKESKSDGQTDEHSADASKMVPAQPTPPKPKPFETKPMNAKTVRNASGTFDLFFEGKDTNEAKKTPHAQSNARFRSSSQSVIDLSQINPKETLKAIIADDTDVKSYIRNLMIELVSHKVLVISGEPAEVWDNQRARWGNHIEQTYFPSAIAKWKGLLDYLGDQGKAFEWTKTKGMPQKHIIEAMSVNAQGHTIRVENGLTVVMKQADPEDPIRKAEERKRKAAYERWVKEEAEDRLSKDGKDAAARYENWLKRMEEQSLQKRSYFETATPEHIWKQQNMENIIRKEQPFEKWRER